MGAAVYPNLFGSDMAFAHVWLGGLWRYQEGENRLTEVVIRIVATPGALTVAKPTFHSVYCHVENMTEVISVDNQNEYHEWTVKIDRFIRRVPSMRTAIEFMNWSIQLNKGVDEAEPHCETRSIKGASGELPFRDIDPSKIVRVCPGVISMHHSIRPYLAAEPNPNL